MWPFVKTPIFPNVGTGRQGDIGHKKERGFFVTLHRIRPEGKLRHSEGEVLADTYYIDELLSFY